MELTPQTLHAVEFREARRGGYNTRDVDDFLERVAQGVGSL
jgi:DivIVA domain-containing protein